MTKQADLIAYVFDGKHHLLSRTLRQWMETSSRFTAFVDTYRDKIRKKVRVTRDAESALDLRGELEVAYCLLKDRRMEVAYEPYASAKRRGLDFAVTYRVNLVFNIEVARIRMEAIGDEKNHIQRLEERFLRVLLGKLGQMQPGMPNLLVIHARSEVAQAIDLVELMQEVNMRVDRKDSSFYALGSYTNPAAFYKDYLRLNGIIVWTAEAQLWVNKQARPALAEKLLRLVSSLPSSTAQSSAE